MMNTQESSEMRDSIITDVEELVTEGVYTFEEVVDEIKDRLCHLWE